MPTTPAADSAAADLATWAGIAERWTGEFNPDVWDDLPGSEALVIPEVSPRDDLERRARRWAYPLRDGDLADTALFAAALARAEVEAWESGDGVLATQAYEERRFLASDRIAPWAVPWLLAVARCFPENRMDATDAAAALLAIGERHRLAPALAGAEGLHLPDHDGYGPSMSPVEPGDRVGSLWGGMVVFRRSLTSLTGEPHEGRIPTERWLADTGFRANLSSWYEVAVARWGRMAELHPGTAGYWLDLARRADHTAKLAK
jgi:hypothetical protein